MVTVETSPLAGLTVVEIGSSLPGALVGQFLADAGADVVVVERQGGSSLRRSAGWPALARGKHSVVLDLAADRPRFDGLVASADVVVSTLSIATTRRLDLEAEQLAAVNPAVVSAAITGWGSTGPWADLPGYEGLVMAKVGLFHAKRRMANRAGPAFVSVPYASWGAAHAALHGILAALVERESSGVGQHVEADLVRGLGSMDIWNWFTELIGVRWPGAYEVVDSFDETGEPASPLPYSLLVAPTKDGHWLQFAQTAPRLFHALLRELELGHLLDDPEWTGIPVLAEQDKRSRLWTMMIDKVRRKTLAEWEQVFARNNMIAAELFRTGREVLAHPQLGFDGRVAVADDPERGPVRQPSTLVHVDGAPLRPARPAPRLGSGDLPTASPRCAPASAAAAPPLSGVTVLEFATMYAAPYGATLLAELGARVIKIETPAGDEIRRLLPFPEAGGAKVMQGKESVAVDLTSPDGKRIVQELAARADIVLQAFRGDAAQRLGIDRATLRRYNPELIYVSAPGYGTTGEWGSRPAYAPSIGAAGGFALTDAPDAAGRAGSVAEIKRTALRLNQATSIAQVNADGVAAVAVASAMLLGLLARRRGRPMGELTTTMLASAAHMMVERTVDHPDQPDSPAVDAELMGTSALYRLYQAADGWVFLAAPTQRDWARLAGSLELEPDTRLATSEGRAEHDQQLRRLLAAKFATRSAAEWEKHLTAAGIGCVQVTQTTPELLFQTDESLASTYCVSAHHPVFDEHLRLAPLVSLSRSSPIAHGGCMAGEHTDDVLAELGYAAEAVARLRAAGVIA